MDGIYGVGVMKERKEMRHLVGTFYCFTKIFRLHIEFVFYGLSILKIQHTVRGQFENFQVNLLNVKL